MKRFFSLCTVLLFAFGLFSCGKPAPTPETTAPETTAAPAEETTAQPVSFRLPSLPDIGGYRQKKPTYFYDAPLREFEASDGYGTIVPYCVASNGEVGSYGFMTADGKIITDPVYSSISLLEGNGRTVYSARQKVFFFDNAKDGDASGDSGKRNMTELIAVDGSKCVRLPDVTPQTGYHDSVFIECKVWAHDGGFIGDTFYLYDFDLELVADLTEYGVVNGSLIAESAERFVVADWERATYFENGAPVKTVPLDDMTFLPNGMICDRSQVYDENGEVVCSFTDDFRCEYDDQLGALLIVDEAGDRVIKIKDGKTEAEYRVTEGSLYDASAVRSDGECRVVVSLGEKWNAITGYLVLDENLDLLTTVDISGTSFARLVSDDWAVPPVCCFLLGRGGRTDICGLSGETLATLPFLYDQHPDITDGCVFFCKEDVPTFRFSFADRSLTEYASVGPARASERAVFVNDSILIRGYYLTGRDGGYDPEFGDYRYLLTDPATGGTLYDGVTDLEITELENRTWISFAVNGVAYVFDGDMNLITAFTDGYYA